MAGIGDDRIVDDTSALRHDRRRGAQPLLLAFQLGIARLGGGEACLDILAVRGMGVALGGVALLPFAAARMTGEAEQPARDQTRPSTANCVGVVNSIASLLLCADNERRATGLRGVPFTCPRASSP